MKSFLIQQFFKNVGEVWASSPHLRSKFYWYPICNLFSLLQSHIFKLSRSNLENQGETKAKIQARQRGDCSTLAGKSRGRTPLLPDGSDRFPEEHFLIAFYIVLKTFSMKNTHPPNPYSKRIKPSSYEPHFLSERGNRTGAKPRWLPADFQSDDLFPESNSSQSPFRGRNSYLRPK